MMLKQSLCKPFPFLTRCSLFFHVASGMSRDKIIHEEEVSLSSFGAGSMNGARSAMPTMPPRDSNGSLYFPSLCYDLLDTFQFPVFEILVTLQVVLPVFYSFFIPCVSVFIMECSCRNRSQDALTSFRRKLSTVLVGSWMHWYMHWELWSWFWSIMAFYSTIFCAMPARFYEYTIGLSITSIMVCLVSNTLSDFRTKLKRGPLRILFNMSCCCLASWMLRFAYPCFLNIGILDEFDIFWDDSNMEPTPPATPPPPEYSEAVESGPPPPSYAETLSRIRSQVPKLQRSISLQAQRWGRRVSLKSSKVSVQKKSMSLHVESTGGDSVSRQEETEA